MNKCLINKGFTLVELLAVMVILVSVSFVAVGGITESLLRRDKRECEEQQKLAISAAKMYFSLDGKGNSSVNIKTLKDNGYIKEGNKVDLLEEDDIISFDNSGYLYNSKTAGKTCG